MKNGTCPKCGSHVLIKDEPIIDRGQYSLPVGYLSFIFQGRKTSPFTHNVARGEIRAWICGECGYTELYTTNFKELLAAERESQAT